MSEINRQFRLASRPTGEPDLDDFDLVESEVPTPEHGEVLVKTCYLSVDPYMRGRMRDADSYAEPWDVGDVMKAGVVGEVVESNHDQFAEGDIVAGNLNWAEYATAKGHQLTAVNPEHAPISTALGVLGMPGRTAYFGLLEVAEPKPGDTVVVSGAAGAVGSVVGQLAQLAGCRVVGFAGSDEKTAWLTEDLGFDAAINYKTTDSLDAALTEAAPEGVDVYYDNVGGPITDAVMRQLNVDARVAVCGQISQYNATEPPQGPRKFGQLIVSRARVEGFLVRDFESQYEEATERLASWVASGDIEYRESVVEGFENAPEAFLGLFSGDNIGKQLVKVAEPSLTA
ncbi:MULTISPECIES: NADP-dependent oxidoreductase [unclassified Haladaptatus]|uniref:NADP-dependent oxidoreductase n=1 Tax=unclassified Haladaptatus TaxID=2622732 RepID=UPI0023E7D5C6|nr:MULTISPECIES: NADP-dependent oxidoreductase [unclassified Haladaptatus]